MRTIGLTTLRSGTLAGISTALLILSGACNKDVDATGPRAAAQSRAALATLTTLSAISTDPISDIVNAAMAAWAAKDATAYAALFAADAQLINPVGAVFIGRDALRNIHIFLFNGPFAGSTLTFVVRDIRFLTGTVAIVYLDLSITGYAFPPPGTSASADGVIRARVTWVVEKRGGEWQIVSMQNTSRP
jgi:uncharacterized protein (TIGR02246 family)